MGIIPYEMGNCDKDLQVKSTKLIGYEVTLLTGTNPHF